MSQECGICGARGERFYDQDDCPGFLGCAKVKAQIQESHRGVEEQTDGQYMEARAAYEAAPKPTVEICSCCNEPIIDGQASGHKPECESNQEIAF